MKVCVIGGGAAGMMCATMIARKGHHVTLFEQNEKLGKKLYITGKGRCNVTNVAVGDEFLKNVVNGKKFVMGAVTRFNSSDVKSFFEDLGVELKIERGGRVFPVSDKSSDIIKAMEKAMRWAGVDVKLNSKVEKVLTQDDAVCGVCVNGEKLTFDSVVVATGGVSYPSTGSTGDGYKFAEEMGHTIIKPKSALCAIVMNDSDIRELQGLSLKNVKFVAKFAQKIVYESEVGEMLFTANGVSGPIVLSCSSFVNKFEMKDLKMFIDFKPALSNDALLNRIDRDIEKLRAKQFSSLLEGFLPKSLVKIFAKRLNINLTFKANQVDKEKRKKLAFLLKNFELSPKNLEDFNSAIITSGGVNLKEINPKYMKSKIVSNLYFVGEVLDIDALTGGFNLQLAFSTAVTCASDFKDIRG